MMVQQYLDHCREILTSPYTIVKGGSKEVPLVSLFGVKNEYDLREGFPLLTTKRVPSNSIVNELLWFMSGETNIKYLVDNYIPIWTRDAFNHNYDGMVREGLFSGGLVKYSTDWVKALQDYEGEIKNSSGFAERWADLGPVYGAQWRKWKSVGANGEVIEVDQFATALELLASKPTTKKNIVTAWNPGELSRMALEPCHRSFQLYSDGKILDLQMDQRSCDQFLGVPFNIASYAMLTQIMAQQVGLQPRRFIHSFGDSHFYAGTGERGDWYRNNFSTLQAMVRNAKVPQDYLQILDDLQGKLPNESGEGGYDHVTAVLEQLGRTPTTLPKLKIANKPFGQLTINDFTLEGYNPQPMIKRKMAV